MKNIVLLGAGRSSSVLLDYLKEHADEMQWRISVADVSLNHAKEIVKAHRSFSFHDLSKDVSLKEKLIAESDIVISMLPANCHAEIARFCITHGRSTIAIATSKVALPVNKGIALAEILRHSHQGVVDR